MATVVSDQMAAQRTAALERANQVRIDRAALLRELRSLPRDRVAERLAELLDDPPACLRSLLVWEFLSSVSWCSLRGGVRERGHSRVGRTKRLMIRSGVSSWATVGSLTPRAREALCVGLREGATR